MSYLKGFVAAAGEYLAAVLGDAQGVFPLGRQAAVAGGDGPAVLLVESGVARPALIIGSMVKVMPGSSTMPVPLRP